MKPGDHPEFFRFPPPEGRSRESTIVLDKRGRFFHNGEPVTHPGMRRSFASWVRRHPDDGRYILSNGYDWTYLTVEGPSRFVDAVRSRQGAPVLVLMDGSEQPLDPRTLRVDAGGELSAALPDGEPAAFTSAAQLQLEPWLSEREGVIGVRLGEEFFPLVEA